MIDLGRRWVFERTPRMGGATGEAFTNTLNSTGMPRSAVLAREAVQNSVDAQGDFTKKVQVIFRTASLHGEAKDDFVAATGLKEIKERQAALLLTEPNCLAALSDPDTPLRLLYVDDFATTGLAGDPSDPSSKFYRFFLSIGDGGKVHEEHGTGGSYGFGKSVYSSNSSVQTIFAYSRTKDADGKPLSLLFGAAYFKAHQHDEARFTGRAWFGHDLSEESGGHVQVVVPLQGDRAEETAAALGFGGRAETDFGTSVLIVDAAVDAASILQGVEDWWWPRIVSDGLDVEIRPEIGDPMIPRPRSREHLRPFVEAFDVATGKSPAKAGREQRVVYNKSDNLSIGVCGLRVLDRTDEDTIPVDESRIDSVALIRSPKMVVAYHRGWSPGTPPTVGVFIADDDIDDILRASESAAHDIWDVDSQRLRDASGLKRRIVSSVLARIRKSIKDFQRAASPPPPPRPRHLSIMEKALANFLSPSRPGPGPSPDAGSAPIHLVYQAEPTPVPTEDGRIKLVARYSVRLKDECEEDSVAVSLKAQCFVLADGADEEELEISTALADESPLPKASEDGEHQILLQKGQTVHLRSVSAPYDLTWTVRFVPTVSPSEVGQ